MTRREVEITSEADIARARHSSRCVAEEIGFDRVDTHAIMTSVSELASNVFYHARGGRLEFRRVEIEGCPGIEITARDEGPGIACVLQAVQDGYSTAGGLGGGLPGVNRLMHEVEIHSIPDRGTRVTARMFIRGRDPLKVHSDAGWEMIEGAAPFDRLYLKRVGDTFLFRTLNR